MRAGLRCKLRREGAHSASRADDQHGLTCKRPKRLNDFEPGDTRSRERRRHHRVEWLRQSGEVGILADGDILGVGAGGAKRCNEQLAEDKVAGSEPRGVFAD